MGKASIILYCSDCRDLLWCITHECWSESEPITGFLWVPGSALEVTKVTAIWKSDQISRLRPDSSPTSRPPSGSLCGKVRPFGKSNDLCVTSVTF